MGYLGLLVGFVFQTLGVLEQFGFACISSKYEETEAPLHPNGVILLAYPSILVQLLIPRCIPPSRTVET